MTNIHDTIARSLIDELRPLLPRCNLTIIEIPGNPPQIRVGCFGTTMVTTLHMGQNGISVGDRTLIEYCDPNFVDLLVRHVESEVSSFLNIKAAVRKRYEATKLEPSPPA